jgi:hypothetical protein
VEESQTGEEARLGRKVRLGGKSGCEILRGKCVLSLFGNRAIGIVRVCRLICV